MQLELDLEQIELGRFEHYMQKEIYEQPAALRNTFRGRISLDEGKVILGGLTTYAKELVRASRVVLTGQGTALHAAMIGEYMLEDLAKIPARASFASEFRYRNPIIEDGTVVIAVSQSGETADTLAALEEAKDRGALSLGVVNVVGSTISRQTDAGVYLRVGPEIGVASTKAFVGQVAVLSLITLFMARRRVMSADQCTRWLEQLQSIPDKVERVLEQSDRIKKVTERYCDRENWLFLGRGYNYPTALEGALKLKEISYIHAEGMPAAEMKHGPIALINEGMPAVFIATKGRQYDKVMSNIAEVRARGGHVIAVATEGDEEIKRHVEEVLYVPEIIEPPQPHAHRDPSPTHGLPRRRHPRPRRRQAPQPRQVRHRRVIPNRATGCLSASALLLHATGCAWGAASAKNIPIRDAGVHRSGATSSRRAARRNWCPSTLVASLCQAAGLKVDSRG
jgi:glucosamine--fructose-6-phosphate aminotransferase (isomerizing)